MSAPNNNNNGGAFRGGLNVGGLRGGMRGGAPRGSGRLCYKCQQSGHIAANCPNDSGSPAPVVVTQAPPPTAAPVQWWDGATSSASAANYTASASGTNDNPSPIAANDTPRASATNNTPPAIAAKNTPSAYASTRWPVPPGLFDETEEQMKEPAPRDWPAPANDEERKMQDKRFVEFYKARGFHFIDEDAMIFDYADYAHMAGHGEGALRHFVRHAVVTRIGTRCRREPQQGMEVESGVATTMSDAEIVEELNGKRAIKRIAAEAVLKDLLEGRPADGDNPEIKPSDDPDAIIDAQHEVNVWSSCFEPYRPHIRWDNDESEPPWDTREADEQLRDVETEDPSEETGIRFGLAIKMAKEAKLIPESYKAGDIWGPVPTDENPDVYVDPGATSTFYGFYPRHHRPDRIGAGHLGYDDVYMKQTKGERYTSADVKDRVWENRLDAPLVFVKENGEHYDTVNVQLKDDNPCLPQNHATTKPLRTILLEEEAQEQGHQDENGSQDRNNPTPGPSQSTGLGGWSAGTAGWPGAGPRNNW